MPLYNRWLSLLFHKTVRFSMQIKAMIKGLVRELPSGSMRELTEAELDLIVGGSSQKQFDQHTQPNKNPNHLDDQR
ncbi:hypothetical protein FG476_03140 [Xylella fastidiosa subsp. multiplex]|uniref:Uncharacterized protein n=3 Tax=Xylella fastidiosa TaxID=2371 RepID=A0A9Q4QS47_XYLFS|nr:hypothetical protein [Xylella fastidiosa subsp. multiplex]TNW20769.1 hypothetical protein C5H14_01885 [Xylella fastidiosa]MBE0276188.1 hypothetical protein [Xylella fastidiosa subsp. multiplex]MBE0277769.1 hypothetical protein [Xylella fastidiosa subsp. multiplex]MBE0282278.1 hypothetical protein [Xylella fastidiosa subsp. multiplex]